MDEENGVLGIDVAAVEQIIAKTINETARGDPEALACRIVAALAEAGYRISPVEVTEDTHSHRAEPAEFVKSVLSTINASVETGGAGGHFEAVPISAAVRAVCCWRAAQRQL